MGKVAFITGCTGQDGSFLSENLLNKGYKVIGLVRRSSTPNTKNIDHIKKEMQLEYGDVSDQGCIDKIIMENKPDEVYNLAAQSFVPTSWCSPTYTAEVNSLGPLKILESIRNFSPDTKFYQASTSEMFGKVVHSPQNELTPFYPRSPYGVAKVYGHWITVNYRESFNLFASSGILFNHESERRGEEFVTRKITKAVCRIQMHRQDKLYLGNLEAKRDWGYSKDYVEWMWRILQHDKPDTFVIGTGENHTIREFCEIAFNCVHLDYRDYVEIDPKFYRPAEVETLLADTSKAKKDLGFKLDTSFAEMVAKMVWHDYEQELMYGKGN